MMKKYLISIESSESVRLKNFFQQSTFSNYKSDFITFGVVGKELSVSEYFCNGVAGKQKAMTPSELGCCLSHLAALKDFLASQEDYAIIFEDDAIQRFDIDLNKLEQDVRLLNLTPSFFLSLGGIQMKICRKLKGTYQADTLYSQALLKVDPYYYENFAYAYAYIVDRSMAQVLLDFHKIPQIYDHWNEFSFKEHVQIYVTYLFDHPKIENQVTMSYLESERENMKTKNSDESGLKASYLIKKIRGVFLKKYKVD